MAVKVLIQADSSARRQGILRVRGTICEGNRLASLRFTGAQSNLAGRGIFLVLLMWGTLVSATTYYVSSSLGSDGNSGNKSGTEKKDAAMLFLQNALSTVDAVAAREIIDPEKFKDGISKIIDGTVACLNASTWCKATPAANSQPSA